MTGSGASMWAAGAMLCIAAGTLRAEAPVAADGTAAIDGTVTITLGSALPYSGRNEPSHFAGPRSTFRDLRIDLLCRGGEWDANVWAFSECMPGVEHKGELTSAGADANGLHLEIDLPISHHLPAVLGGRCRYTIDLQRVGRRLSGTFTGSSTVPTAKAELEALVGEWATGEAKKAKTEWMGRLDPQAEIKGDAIGEIAPMPQSGQASPGAALAGGRGTAGAGKHPRLFFDAGELPALKSRASDGLGAQSLAAMVKLLESMDANEAGTSRDDADGYAAAGWGLLYALRGDANAAQQAGRWARRAMTTRPATGPVGLSRKLAGVAAAYDMSWDAWPADLRADSAAWLAGEARQIATMRRTAGVSEEMSVRPWPVQGAYDYELAMLRAAGGLAALAVRAEGQACGDDATICGRSVRRFLQRAIGDRGCDAGGCGFEKVLETVMPLVQAQRRCGGGDLAEGTGAGIVGLWGMMTDGRTFAPAGTSPMQWLPLTMGVLEQRYRPLAAEYAGRAAKSGVVLGTPWHGVMMLVNGSEGVPAGASPASTPARAAKMPLRLEDRQMGGLVFRSGQEPNDAVTVLRRAGGPWPAAHLAGNFTVAALGREWITCPPQPGQSRWPARQFTSTVQIHAAAQRDVLQAAFPAVGGRSLGVRPFGTGGGCVAVECDLFSHDDVRTSLAGGPCADVRPLNGGRLRRTLAVDYSGISGAEVLIVIVDEVAGFLPRQPVWQAFVGPLGRDRVAIDGGTFRVAPAGTGATMTGTMLLPAGAVLEYAAPPADAPGAHGRIEAWFSPRGATNAELFRQSHDKKRGAVGEWLEQDELEREHAERMDAKTSKYEDGRRGQKGLGDLVAERMMKEVAGVDADRAAAQRQAREAQAAAMLAKLAAGMAGDPQGNGADRMERARGTFVTVLTIQSGPAPKVSAGDGKSPALLTVGRQTVTYSENVIEFAASR